MPANSPPSLFTSLESIVSEESVIRVNFGRPIPLFPLGAVVLMPHGVLPLNVFEDRYRQMMTDVLDTTGQIAMAVYERSAPDEDGPSRGGIPTPVRPAVCVGQILDHQRLPDGRFQVVVQGVCRAKIVHELPMTTDCPYRQAMLEPIGLEKIDEAALAPFRHKLRDLLAGGVLTELRDAAAVLEHFENPAIPTSALLELLTLSFITDHNVRYRLLATPDARFRARIIERELRALAGILVKAAPQRQVEWPKGCSWN